MSEEKCVNCKFYDPLSKYEGLCKRFPPYPNNDFLRGYWVPVQDDSWCGEFKLKNKEDNSK